jgi:hypothetical protein
MLDFDLEVLSPWNSVQYRMLALPGTAGKVFVTDAQITPERKE